MAISDQVALTTVRIEVATDKGGSVGTGFFFFFNEVPGVSMVFTIVTNRHVIEGANQTRFLLPVGDPKDGVTRAVIINHSTPEQGWITHPDGLDLAILPMSGIAEELHSAGSKVAVTPFRIADIATRFDRERMVAVEDILMMGYPTGLWDQANNRPIARRGVTASDIKLDFNVVCPLKSGPP